MSASLWGRSAGVAVAFTLLITGCGLFSETSTAGEPVDGEATSSVAAGNTTTSGDTDREEATGDDVITVVYPTLPAITVHDPAALTAAGDVLGAELDGLDDPDAGLDVVSPACDGSGVIRPEGELDVFDLEEVPDYLNLEGSSHVQLTTDPDGTRHYLDLSGDNNLSLDVAPDGSGRLADLGGDRNLTVEVAADGSGTLDDLGGDRNLSIEVAADGSGTYQDLGGDRNFTVEVDADGLGSTDDLGGDNNRRVSIDGDGDGSLRDLGGDRNLDLTVEGAQVVFRDLGGNRNLNLERTEDGSVSFRDLGGDRNLSVEVAPDGSGRYQDVSSGIDVSFDAEGEATDGSGRRVVVPEFPSVAVADRIPPLGTLGRLTTPCAVVLRLSADVLFDFDQATLRPEADEVLAGVAAALAGTDAPLQVEGHTDAIGTDEYNDDLSLRRADAVVAALTDGGVTAGMTAVGYGETRPIAPNTKPDGEDDPAGRALNRRVEIVVGG
ncbi:MAG: OmpA family protein [Acidimicrobiales bacterium]